MIPFLWPYLQVAREYGHVRSLEGQSLYVAGLDDYLPTAGRLHFALWSEPFYRRSNLSLFPGVVPILLAMLAIALVQVEALRAPFTFTPFDGIPNLYALLRDQPHAVIAEFPFDDPQHTHENAYTMLNTTLAWHQMVNGHSAFIPRSYRDLYPQVADFPAVPALNALRAAGVTHVVVHTDRFGPMPADVVGLTLMARGKNIILYALEAPPASTTLTAH